MANRTFYILDVFAEEKYAGNQLAVVRGANELSSAAMQKRAREKNYPFDYLIDEEQKIYPRFGATKTPHVFILNADLEVQYIGTIDDNPQDASSVKTKYVENAITALSQGKKPDPAETRAIGCGIR